MRAILLILLLAQHTATPSRSPEEECQRVCHVKHCDGYVACIGTPDPMLCRLGVNREEERCIRQCTPEKS